MPHQTRFSSLPHRNFLSLFLCCVVFFLMATSFAVADIVIPDGGKSLFTNNPVANFQPQVHRNGSLQRVVVEKTSTNPQPLPFAVLPFDTAVRCQTTLVSGSPWDFQLRFATQVAVEKGDTLFVKFYARNIPKAAENTTGPFATSAVITPIFEQASSPYDKSLQRQLEIGNQWQCYYFPFKSLASYAPGAASFSFHLGIQPQTVEIADIVLLSYGQTPPTSPPLPLVKIPYPGQEPNAAWRTAAEQRIDHIRKGTLEVIVKDTAGNPVPNAKVQFQLKKHHFGFGSAVSASRLLADTTDGEKYREIVESSYSRVVFENDLKWPVWENPTNRENTPKAVQWLAERGIEIRGHCLIWPSWKHTPRDLQGLATEPEKLRQRINSHITEEVSTLAGKIVDWDVINEPYDNNDVMKVLGDEEMIEWFKLAHKHDPAAKLTLNDYSIIIAGGFDKKHQDHFEKTLRFLKDGGAPITGLGIQGHFRGSPTPPERMLAILDRYAALGLDISITEHDFDTDDEELQADFTRDFLITMFSHPQVTSILTWGFWEKAHWRPAAAYYRTDWSLKPAGKVWNDLVLGKWWTNETATTDTAGKASCRGFLGMYDIIVTVDGASKTTFVGLDKTGTMVVVQP